jgi:hypothetical protein
MPFDPPGHGDHAKFVKDVEERWRFYRDQRMEVVRDTLNLWDLYLTRRREFRAKGEEWRANLALPDAFANTETMVANLVGIMLSADPVVQPEGVQDSHMETARSVERLIDYAFRRNAFPKWLTKVVRARSVAGTCFYKLTWVEQAHTVTLSRDAKAVQRFEAAVQGTMAQPGIVPAPNWLAEPEAFETWRKLVTDSGRARIPAPPLEGPQRIIRYRGPKLHVLPITSVYLDPLTDELAEQNFILHRVVKPLSWLEERVAAGLYDEAAVAYAMEGWDGQVREDEEVALAAKMGIMSDSGAAADPYYAKAVELWELWQPGALYPYSLLLNRRAVVNKRPTEMPFIHGEPTIGATRGVVVPGHFYGISALAPPSDLFWEKRKLRNLRVDAVTLNVLPAYLKLREVGLPEMMHKIRPGALIPASRPDAISPLVRDPLPPEAYREPADMDMDIADAMGVHGATKGRDAPIGRVTGTEFQGRENRAQIRFKLDSIFLEEDLAPINRQIIAMFAQMGDDPLVLKVGGEPNPVIELDRNTLMESMETQWRFRGPNKAINRDMQVQHLLMWVKTFGANLTPTEYRYAARLILDLLDVRGVSKLVSVEGTTQKTQEYQMQAEAAALQQQAQIRSTQAANINVPPTVGGEAARAMGAADAGEAAGPPPPAHGAKVA